jgi:hypothetical protein
MFFYAFFSSAPLPEVYMPALCPPEMNIDKDEIEKLQKEIEVRLINRYNLSLCSLYVGDSLLMKQIQS